MVKILYVSSSVFPSQSANSINVLKMGSAFSKNGYDVKVLGIKGKQNKNIFEYYNINEDFQIITSKNKLFNRIIHTVTYSLKADIVYSRWALGGFIAGVLLRKPVIFEFHHYPQKNITNWLEKKIIKSKNTILNVFITEKLLIDYKKKYRLLHEQNTIVAPDGADKQDIKIKEIQQNSLLSCIYLGSLYDGKGVNVVLEIAREMPQNTFHIVGGTVDQIIQLKKKYNHKNIIWHGHLEQEQAFEVLKNSDIALLPNQKRIVLSDNKTDIGKWTSPMKMFEYMSFGKAIIASKLEVLKEVLVNRNNSILVSPTNTTEWVNAVAELQNDIELYRRVSSNAKKDLEEKYTWDSRVKNIMKVIKY